MSDSRKAFLPNFCAIRMVFAVVISAELLAFVLTLATYAPAAQFWQTLSFYSMYVQWVALASAGLLCLSRAYMDRLSHAQAGVIAWLIIMLLTALLFVLIKFYIRTTLEWHYLSYNLAIAAIVSALLLRYLFEQHRENERKLAESQARFQALQARIRPHFLFNSMNTIASLTQIDANLAEQVVQDVSDLFRASLSDVSKRSSLGDEIELARGYLRIEQQRLGERLRITWDIESLPLQAQMPTLMLQPLLENAVYHGIEPAINGGEIAITGRYRRNIVNLSIVNSLPDQRKETERKGNQIALRNVRERLQQVYGEQADVRIGLVDEHFQTRLVFPYRDAE